MGPIRGNAAFTYTDPDVSMTERVLLLREPIREIRPAARQSVFVAESLDFQSRQVFTIGTGVDEIVCRVRFMDDPQGVMDLVKAGAKGRTLTYHPDLDDPSRTHAYLLISPSSPSQLGMDSDTGTTFGDVEVELRLRSTS